MREFFYNMGMGKTFLIIQNPDTTKEKIDKFDDIKITFTWQKYII